MLGSKESPAAVEARELVKEALRENKCETLSPFVLSTLEQFCSLQLELDSSNAKVLQKQVLKMVLFDRLAFEEISLGSTSLHWFTYTLQSNAVLLSEVCVRWFDGTLMTNTFPTLRMEICESFAAAGWMGILQLAIRIVKTLHVHHPFPTSSNTNDDAAAAAANQHYARVYSQAPELILLLSQGTRLCGEENNNDKESTCKVFFIHKALPLSGLGLKQYARSLQADWIGFDLDFTLVDMDETERLRLLIWHSVRRAVRSKKWPLMVNLVFIRFFAQPMLTLLRTASAVVEKNSVIDIDRGNILVLDAFKQPLRCMHGSLICVDTYSISNNTNEFAYITTLFETPMAFMFAHCVDILDSLGESKHYRMMYNSICEAFAIAHTPSFKYNFRGQMLQSPTLFKKQTQVKQWLERLKRSGAKQVFLLSDAKEVHVNAMMVRGFGTDWRDLFDLIIVDAHKDQYFTLKLNVDDIQTYTHKYCTGGNIDSFRKRVGAEARVVYFGDNCRKDVCLPDALAHWMTVFVEGENRHHGIRIPSPSQDSWSFCNWKFLSDVRQEQQQQQQPPHEIFTLNGIKLFRHAQFVVPNLKFCAQQDLFLQ